MSCFRIPSTLCADIGKLYEIFWWGMKEGGHKLHWKDWRWLCKPKHGRGMGFKILVCFNQALLAKHVWRLITEPHSLVARLFNARYYRHYDIMEVVPGSNSSFVWRPLCWEKNGLNKGLKWIIGSGEGIDANLINWFGGGIITGKSTCSRQGNVVADYLNSDRCWDEGKIRTNFLPYEADLIINSPVGRKENRDSRFWAFDPKSKYLVRSGYIIILAEKEAMQQKKNSSNIEVLAKWWKST
ncbi:hypothetical protein ACS0TY_008554 [Phlomoides rotata]